MGIPISKEYHSLKRILVEVKFNSYRIISHYYNNIFSLHMHTFIISVFFSTHSTLPFIKTSYSNIIENSHNNINIKFNIEVFASLYY